MHAKLRDQQVCSNAQRCGSETASSKNNSCREAPMFPEPSQGSGGTWLYTLEVDHENKLNEGHQPYHNRQPSTHAKEYAMANEQTDQTVGQPTSQELAQAHENSTCKSRPLIPKSTNCHTSWDTHRNHERCRQGTHKRQSSHGKWRRLHQLGLHHTPRVNNSQIDEQSA